MSYPTSIPLLVSAPGEPTWEIARLFPEQGAWSEEEYLELSGNRLIEFSNGSVEVLTMPTQSHQLIALYLYRMLAALAESQGLGRALAAPFRVRLWLGKYREPDVLFMLAKHASRMGEMFWEGADLVMEVVSDDDRRRDLDLKRREYALAGIPEYWIVDPQQSLITVLRLEGDRYVVQGEFGLGTQARSCVLPAFAVDVSAVFGPRG